MLYFVQVNPFGGVYIVYVYFPCCVKDHERKGKMSYVNLPFFPTTGVYGRKKMKETEMIYCGKMVRGIKGYKMESYGRLIIRLLSEEDGERSRDEDEAEARK